ncbi:hypothetical protein [Undibacterium parvum]|uniref:Uncharacterized protein n=2 Tax=Undibacterium TaxID=401469 RepID=A0A6M4A1B0_9BURK|nr:hypothetical protein [Undibacterium parvum]AZP14027.1 hypothetical protein EJN92_19725 [Undibacterium parvum]QJQ04975.1 hypothetical protein EJG51_002900 [Undibacterium piscinae]
MKKISTCLLLLSVLSSGSICAQEKNLCKILCVSEKKECRKTADAKLQTDTHPFITESNSNSRNQSGQDMQARINSRQTQKNDSKNLRIEKYNACDSSYMQCVKLCAQENKKDAK